jgi:hypothetical protein
LLLTAHRDGQHEAKFFHDFGFKVEAWEELASALLNFVDGKGFGISPCGEVNDLAGKWGH